MNWVDIVVIIILGLSFLGGVKEGAVKNVFSLAALLIALYLTSLSYHLLTNILSFLPGTDWETFLGFFITLGIISVIMHLIFLLPVKLIEKIWPKGLISRLIGGVLNVINAAIGLTVFTLLLTAYPIISWLARAVSDSGILASLLVIFSFVQALLPGVI